MSPREIKRLSSPVQRAREAQDLRIPRSFHNFRPSADHAYFNQDLHLPNSSLPTKRPSPKRSPRKPSKSHPVSKLDLYLPKRSLLNEALLVPLSAKRQPNLGRSSDRLEFNAAEVQSPPPFEQASAHSEEVLYQIDIDISKERKVTLRVRPGDDVEQLLQRVKAENELSQKTFLKLKQAVTESIDTYMSST